MRRPPLKNILVIIPVFNEGKNIGAVIDKLGRQCPPADVLIINDGSFDNTAEVLLGKKGIIVIEHIFNMGIGASLQTGCIYALEQEYDYVARMDGDGQHDPVFFNDIIKPVISGEADIAIGSRFLGAEGFKSSFFRLIGIKFISAFLMMITKRKVTDPTSGFCAMNRRAYEFFSLNCVEDYPEPEILIHHRDFKIKEVAVSMSKRQSGTSSITQLKSFYYMYKVLFSLFVGIFRKEEK